MQVTSQKLLRLLFIVIWLLALAHIAAEHFYLYWTYRWLDIPIHLLGGVWLGLGGVWLVHYSGYVPRLAARLSTSAAALLSGILIGLLWEVYEHVVWQVSGYGLPDGYALDTVIDLCMDVTGAFAGLFLYCTVVSASTEPTRL